MNNSGIEIIMSSDVSYEKLIAEIYCDGKFVALLNQDNGIEDIVVEFPSTRCAEDKVLRKINLNILEKGIELAKEKLAD